MAAWPLSIPHIQRLRLGHRVQNLLTPIKSAPVNGLIETGIASSKGSTENFSGCLCLNGLFDGNFAVALIFTSVAYRQYHARFRDVIRYRALADMIGVLNISADRSLSRLISSFS